MRIFRLLRVVLLGATVVAAACDGPPPPRGDVLLVILDTARADHFSAYGYPRLTTPNLDRLAREGQRFDEAWAQAPWTLPAMASILTGQPPHVHGAMRGERGIHPLRSDVPALAEQMRQAGYATGAVINVLWCSPELSSLDRGFDSYDFHATDESNLDHRDAGRTTDAALDWIDRNGDNPFFAVVHYFDPHLTFDAPPPYDTMFERDRPRIPPGFGSATEVFKIRDGTIRLGPAERESLLARYDGELRYTDEQFGRLREGLEQRGRWDGTLVVVVADHGEEFWDHGGFEHGHTHYSELLRVPLIVRRPGGPQAEVSPDRVRQIDIAPTILDFAGIPIPDDLPGLVLGTGAAPRSVAEGSLWAGDLVSIRSDQGTLIENRTQGVTEFYDPADRFESERLSLETANARELRLQIEALPSSVAATDPNQLSEEQIEQLRALGYMR